MIVQGQLLGLLASMQAMQHVVGLLHACMESHPSLRAQGEAGLAALSAQPGFGLALAHVSTAPELPDGTKQLAAVVLKKFVRVRRLRSAAGFFALGGCSSRAAQEHWAAGEKHFSPPQVGEEEKAAIRDVLPRGLSDSASKIRTATAMAVAAIAAFDWPESWPALTATLVSAIREKRSHESGAARGCFPAATHAPQSTARCAAWRCWRRSWTRAACRWCCPCSSQSCACCAACLRGRCRTRCAPPRCRWPTPA